jgi:hypothetical protein
MEGFDCNKIGVPLQHEIHKKIDSEKVREGTMKSTHYKEGEIELKISVYKHLMFFSEK